MLRLLLVLACCDDTAQAGAAYRDALEALRLERFEETVTRLQEALRLEPKETTKLLYRDRDGRHADPYHPHYYWSQARALQARSEADPARRRNLLRDALTHLELTEHPEAAALMARVKGDLATAEKIEVPPSREDPDAALRLQIAALCDRECFVEALLLAKNRAPLVELVESRRGPALHRYENAMTLALDAVAVTSPVEKPDAIPLLLKPARMPSTVSEAPGGPMAWFHGFCALYDRNLPTLRNLAAENTESLLRCAQSFEESSALALKAGSFSGFRAACSLADALRASRVTSLAGGRDDVQLDRVLTDAEQALQQRDSALKSAPDPAEEVRKYRSGTMSASTSLIQTMRGRLVDRNRLREDLGRWASKAGDALVDPALMGKPAALRAVSEEGAALRSRPAWDEIPAPLRARAIYDGALLDIIAGILEGESPAALREQSARIRTALALDAQAGKLRETQLSPKIRSWIEAAAR
jgi:hypothetical protein